MNFIYTKMANKCHNCQKDCEEFSKEFYKEELGNIYNIIIGTSRVKNTILNYLYHINGHVIDYKLKYRDEIYNYTITVCTKCFQYGIYLSLNNQKRLPFLRIDINYFTRDYTKSIINNCIINDSIIKKNFNNYIFPSKYVCDYYRNPHPKLINNFFVIDSFNN